MDWNHCYRIGETPWDKGRAAPPLRQWMERGGQFAGRVLVPGCGAGHDAALIGELCPEAEVVGLDIAPLAIERARVSNERWNVRFELGNFFELGEAEVESFDWVVEHTCFSAIDPAMREAYFSAVDGALKEGGRFWAVFYLNPYDNEHPRGGGPPHGVEASELDRLMAGRFELLEEEVPRASYPGREGLELMRVLKVRPRPGG